MAEHRSLTGASIHEPKGADVASANQVYVADGAGSGSWTNYVSGFSNIVEVTSASDFPAAVGGFIVPEADTLYYISGLVDLGSDVINITNSGTALIGFNRATDILSTNSASPLINSVNENVVLQGFTLNNNNLVGLLINLSDTGGNVCILDKVLFGDCDRVGNIGDFSNIIIDNCANNPGTPIGGITFSGINHTEIVVRDSFFSQWTGTMFDLGLSVSDFVNFDSVRFFSTIPSVVAIDGLPSAGNITSVGLGTITNSLFLGMTNPLGLNIDHADTGWFFSDVAGIQESAFVGYCSYTNNATNTTIGGANVWTKVAGTTIASPENERFTMTTDNELTADVILPRPIEIQVVISGEKTSGTDTVEFTVFKDTGGGFAIINPDVVSRTDFSATSRSVSLVLLDTATNGDKYSVYVRNITSADDVEVENLQFFVKG